MVPVKKITIKESFIDRVSKKFVSKAITAVVKATSKDEASVRMVQIISRDPQLSIIHFRNIAYDGQIIEVLSDSKVKKKLKKGSVRELLEDAKFRSLITNPNMRFLKPVSKEYTDKRRDVVATKIIIKAWTRLQRIKDDPRVIEIISNEEFQESLQNDSTFKLMLNDELKDLTDIILGKK